MSIVEYDVAGTASPDPITLSASAPSMQRVGEVRRQQGVSLRTIARRMNVDVASVREQEDAHADLSLSQLYKWQAALEVPVNELLAESEDALSPPVLQRSRLVRLMKSALTIKEHAKQESVRRMVQNLIEQLEEMMPELSDIGPWHNIGKRRRLNELGVAAERRFSEEVFMDLTDF